MEESEAELVGIGFYLAGCIVFPLRIVAVALYGTEERNELKILPFPGAQGLRRFLLNFLSGYRGKPCLQCRNSLLGLTQRRVKVGQLLLFWRNFLFPLGRQFFVKVSPSLQRDPGCDRS